MAKSEATPDPLNSRFTISNFLKREVLLKLQELISIKAVYFCDNMAACKENKQKD